MSNNNNPKVGDVIAYGSFNVGSRIITVTNVSPDIKNGRAGFDGVIVGKENQKDGFVWGYSEQITKFITRANEFCSSCGVPDSFCICEIPLTINYEGKIHFSTDRELTEKELNQLISAIELQIEEPTDADGNDEQFKTGSISFELKVN